MQGIVFFLQAHLLPMVDNDSRVHFLTFYDAHGVLFLFLDLFFYVINISKYILMRAIDHYSGGEEWLGHLVRLMIRHNRSKKANIIIWA